MMLEKHIILVRSATDPSENVATHEVVRVGSKAVNNLGTCQSTAVLLPLPKLTSWSSQMLTWGICPLTVANGAVLYQRM